MVPILLLCIKEKQLEARKIDSEIWRIFFGGRYLITLMAMFSIYTGLIYNDVFSKSLNIFGSSFRVPQTDVDIMANKELMINPALPFDPVAGKVPQNAPYGYYGTPYVFGLDPIWQVSTNKIMFQNAFKMKMSVLLGVTHMLFGVFMSLWNAIYFKKSLNIFAEFIPQVCVVEIPSSYGWKACAITYL